MNCRMIPSIVGILAHVLRSRPSTKWGLDHEAFHFTTLSRNVLSEVNPFLYAVYASALKDL